MQTDVKSAYLYAPISEEIFMYQHQGYVVSNKHTVKTEFQNSVTLKRGYTHFRR